MRDENLLESALARAQQKWHYRETTDIPTLAAAYGFGLVKNHPYRDGNKRGSVRRRAMRHFASSRRALRYFFAARAAILNARSVSGCTASTGSRDRFLSPARDRRFQAEPIRHVLRQRGARQIRPPGEALPPWSSPAG